MSDMFDFYPSEHAPDNRFRCIPKRIITIMAGETATHSFEIPDNIQGQEIKDIEYEAIYKLGLDVVLVKTKEESELPLDDDCPITIITWNLSPEETLLFKDTLLDAHVQLKFKFNDNSILYSDIMKVFLQDALDVSKNKN